MRKLLIDCDPGHDDAIAICLALAHKEKFDIQAITTVGGNQTIEKVTMNALKIVELLGEDIDVIAGASGPLVKALETGAEAHGSTGMDGPILPEPAKKVLQAFAPEHLAKLLRESEDKMTIVALGPLTNIALLLKAYPDVKEKIEEITLMGGGLFEGNKTSAAEFNIYVDPEAAKIVFDSGIPIAMSGLDVTNKAYTLQEEYQHLKTGGKVSVFVSDLLDFYFKYSLLHGHIGSAIHDACAIMYLVRPDIYQWKDYHVDVVVSDDVCRGMTLADTRPKTDKPANVKVLLDVDREAYLKELMAAFETLDKTVK